MRSDVILGMRGYLEHYKYRNDGILYHVYTTVLQQTIKCYLSPTKQHI